MNKQVFEAPKHTPKPRVEESNTRVHEQLTPISTMTPTNRYPTCRTNSDNLIGVIGDTNFQDVILEKVPGNADDAAPQFANVIIKKDTGESL